jgi:spermidine synthase
VYWKTWGGRCVYWHSGGARVHQNFAFRWLTFDDSTVLQTLINRRYPARSALPYLRQLTLAARAQPGDSCLLGLGGAGVAHVLAPYAMPLTAVEQDAGVIDVAAAFFMTHQLPNLNILQDDAALFVQNARARYQHLLVDLYQADAFPTECYHADFFGHCRDLLLPHGVLAINLANLTHEWGILDHVRAHFPLCTVLLPVRGSKNLVILAYKGPSIHPLLALIQRERGLRALDWRREWGYVALF